MRNLLMGLSLAGSILMAAALLAFSPGLLAQTGQPSGVTDAKPVTRTLDVKPDLSGTWVGGGVGGTGAQRTTLAMDSGASMELTKWGAYVTRAASIWLCA